MMKEVSLYTDGACSGNPGKGGYAVILIYNDKEKIITGFEDNTTNNRMELFAVISGLKALKEPCIANVYSDSQYVCGAFTDNWLSNWKNNKWKTSNNKPVKNLDLWQELDSLLSIHKVNLIKVKGHSDNDYNNRCDKLAVAEYKKLQ